MAEPKPVSYYDASTGKEIAVSPQFLDDVKKFPTKTKVAATKWISQGGAGVDDAEEDVDFVGDSFVTDKEGDSSLDTPVLDPLKQYNDFQGAFAGLPQTPELSAFLDAAGTGLDKLDEIQRSLQYRKNTNAWLRSRESANSNSKSVTSSMNPVSPQNPVSPIKLNKAAPGSGTKAPGATKNNSNLERLLPYAKKWAGVYGFPVELACAIMREESSLSPWAVNPSAALRLQGAYGVMQMTLGTAIGLGFRGTPHMPMALSATSPECKVIPYNNKSYPLCLEGAELYESRSANQAAWQSGDDSMGRSTSCLIHPDTNIMYGCQLFASVLEKAFSFGCFTLAPDGRKFAITPAEAKKHNFPIIGPVGLTGEDAITWAFQRYNSSAHRIDYAEKALGFKDSVEKAIPTDDKKPLTDTQKKDAISQYEQSTGGSGKVRQLKSFNSTFINSLRTA